MKPQVWKWTDGWVADLDHGTWIDRSYFDTWERAMDHALWLGLSAGVWSL